MKAAARVSGQQPAGRQAGKGWGQVRGHTHNNKYRHARGRQPQQAQAHGLGNNNNNVGGRLNLSQIHNNTVNKITKARQVLSCKLSGVGHTANTHKARQGATMCKCANIIAQGKVCAV